MINRHLLIGSVHRYSHLCTLYCAVDSFWNATQIKAICHWWTAFPPGSQLRSQVHTITLQVFTAAVSMCVCVLHRVRWLGLISLHHCSCTPIYSLLFLFWPSAVKLIGSHQQQGAKLLQTHLKEYSSPLYSTQSMVLHQEQGALCALACLCSPHVRTAFLTGLKQAGSSETPDKNCIVSDASCQATFSSRLAHRLRFSPGPFQLIPG